MLGVQCSVFNVVVPERFSLGMESAIKQNRAYTVAQHVLRSQQWLMDNVKWLLVNGGFNVRCSVFNVQCSMLLYLRDFRWGWSLRLSRIVRIPLLSMCFVANNG